ncbi:MAG TPA: hypothetical protein VEC57_15965 [Candidatus Limnocylindrales bacterium]|nr:hypothetical protein [Candidatus Limnocylindrales bacterium]
MKRIGTLLTCGCAGLLALALVPSTAGAQLDHLVCYKAVDKLQVAVAFDLFAELQPEFSAKGCRIVKVDDFCVPATKVNVEPAEADERADIVGPPLHVDYIGYLVKCEQQGAPTSKIVVDQFGNHRQRRYRIQKVYIPAKKGPPPCGTVDGKQCGGVCPESSDQCRIVADGTCRCAPAINDVCGGKPDKQGFCGGPCPDPDKPQCQVVVTAAGDKACECGPPPPPICGINTATGTCGGECPNKADKCVFTSANECRCVPASTPCGLIAGTDTCGGDCPIAGDVCARDANDQCRCGAPDPMPCQQNPFTGACGGECPTGQECLLDANGTCSCGPTPCGSDANGQCGGACPDPDAQTCKVDSSGACNCDPPSCGVMNDQCGGLCPPNRECRPVNIANEFRCACQ